MSSSTSHRSHQSNTEHRSRTPIHPPKEMPKDRTDLFSNVAMGINHSLLGPMPARDFLSKFLPLRQDPLPFVVNMFGEVVETSRETSMYEPFCKAVRPHVPRLVIRNMSSRPVEPGTNYHFSIKPDCTVHSKENENVPGTNPRAAEFFIEFKYTSQDDPFITCDIDDAPHNNGQPLGQRSLIKEGQDPRTLIGQIGTYVAVQLDLQYRTHTFFVLITGDHARLMRWDRSGAIFTAPIKYNEEPELLEFFIAYDNAAPEARGIDEYVRKPTKDEIDIATGACKDLCDRDNLLVVSLHDGDHQRHYVINSPSARPSLPIGRSTRTSVAYDLQEKKCVFIKDTWRVIGKNVVVEGDIIEKLNRRRIPNIPSYVDSCDVGDDAERECHITKTGKFFDDRDATWVPSGFEFSFSKLRHHRLVLGTIGKELKEFSSTKELVTAIRGALVAHKEAYLNGVLHRDISPGNILIVDQVDERGVRRGLLIDWDMCKEKDGNAGRIGSPRTSRTGTWPFMAADLVVDKNHKVTQTFIHDLESAFYVLLYQAVRYRPTSLTSAEERSTFLLTVFYTQTVRGLGTESKLNFMTSPMSMKHFKVLDSSGVSCNQPLTTLIRDLKELLGQRHIDEYPERSALSAFLDIEDYNALPYKHDDIIKLFDVALKSSDWPENDGAVKQSTLPDDQVVASRYTCTKRSSLAFESDNPDANSGRSSKRRNLG